MLCNIICYSSDEGYHFRFPAYEHADWLLTGLVVTPELGLQSLPPAILASGAIAYLTVKSPPTALFEGEQFQLHVSVIAQHQSRNVQVVASNSPRSRSMSHFAAATILFGYIIFLCSIVL